MQRTIISAIGQVPTVKRRTLLKAALLSASSTPIVFGRLGNAQELTPLTETDSTGRSLDYHSDAKTVDVHEYPEYEATQSCTTCLHYQVGTGSAHGCKLAPGRSVSADGWCKLWTEQP